MCIRDSYYSAVKGEKFECPIAADTFMDMMYMPDGLRAAIEIMEANPDVYKRQASLSFNILNISKLAPIMAGATELENK